MVVRQILALIVQVRVLATELGSLGLCRESAQNDTLDGVSLYRHARSRQEAEEA